MSIQTLSPPISPTGAEVIQHLKSICKQFPQYCKLLRFDQSDEGRPLEGIVITEKSVPKKIKQHCLIIGGRHGNEESGRIQALGIIDYLVSAAAKKTREQQCVIILPNMNPDGAAQDIYKRPDGVNVCNDYADKNPCPETRAYLKVIEMYPPDAVVDLHARGFTGHSHDMVIHPGTRDYTQDHVIMAEVVKDMVKAGEAAGAIHISHPMTWDGWVSDSPVEQCYRNFKSLCVLTESAESNSHSRTLAQRKKIGVARIKALLKHGNKRHPQSHFSGYPYNCVLGLSNLAVVPYGNDARARRRSRTEIWTQSKHFTALGSGGLEEANIKRAKLSYAGKAIGSGIGLQVRMTGKRRLKSITINGKPVSNKNAISTWKDDSSTFVVVFIKNLKPDTYNFEFHFT